MKIEFNVSRNTVDLSDPLDENPDATSLTIAIGFVSESDVTEFTDLSYGFTYIVDDVETVVVTYPEPGTTIESTDQDILSEDSIPTLPGSECSLHAWADNAGVKIEESITWTTPYYSHEHTMENTEDVSIEELEAIANAGE